MPALPALLWILPGVTIMVFSFLGESTLAASGQPYPLIVAQILIAMGNVGLNLWLIPTQGFLGAAQAYTITSLAWMLTVYGFLAYYMRNPGKHSEEAVEPARS